MAVPPTNTDEAFLREVDEELRRDQALHIWRTYGRWIIAAVVAGLAILAGVLWWQNHRATVAGQQGEQFQRVYDDLQSGKVDAQAKPLADLSGSSVDGIRAGAKFTEADILLSKQNNKAAAAKFAEIANDTGLAKPFRDLALIRQTAAEYDTLKSQVVISRLQALTGTGSPWLGTAGEMVAAAYLQQGQNKLAGELYGRMARDENVPDSIRQRAVQMAGVLGVDAVDQSEEKKAQ